MKQFFLIVLLITGTLVHSQKYPVTQSTDDGLVTSRLSISSGDAMITDYINGLNLSYETAKQKSFASKEDVNAYLGIDLAGIPKLEQIQKETSISITGEISTQFISDLIGIRDRIEAGINSVPELRMALQALATGRLSFNESRCLAMLDLALQRFPSEQQASLSRIPRWLKCAFSVVSGAITGGFTGGTSGITIGTAIAPLGGSAVGAVVGGILGVIGGSFGGAALGC